MREIKFRAWNDGEMVFKVGLDPACVPYAIPEGAEDFESFEYYPEATLMQYTGLKDRNGVEIYEGDIVSGVVSEIPAHVCQGLQQSGMVGKPIKGQIDYTSLYCQFYFTTDGITYLDLCLGLREIEVIGNIYENPELLK